MAVMNRAPSETRSASASPPPELVGNVLGEFRGMATELLDAVRDSLAILLDDQRNRAANEIAALGEVLRRSAQGLDRRGGGTVAAYTEDAGSRIGDFADGLRQRPADELVGEIEEFARRAPLVFMVSAI